MNAFRNNLMKLSQTRDSQVSTASKSSILIMQDNLTQEALIAWANRGLPARLDVGTTAKLLGFAEHDIQILMAAGKLTPLGDPAPNAPKWFAAIEMIRLATDRDWLHKATREISKYWRIKRERRQTQSESSHFFKLAAGSPVALPSE